MDWAFSDNKESCGDSSPEVKNTGGCRFCGVFTIQKCERCGDNYCSDKCYKNDWPNHRYICFPRPALVQIDQCQSENDVYPRNSSSVGSTKNFNDDIKGLRNAMEQYSDDMKSFRAMMELMMRKLDRIEENQRKNVNSNLDNGISNGIASKVNGRKETHDMDSSSTDLCEWNPMLTNDSPKPQPMGGAKIKIEDKELVVLCAFRSTNRCAIRSKNADIEAAYRKIVEEVDRYGKNAPTLKTVPKIGSYAIALKSQKMYTRVKVMKVFNEDRIRVMFCDFGNSVCRKLSDLREISKEIRELPEFVSTVQLHGVNMSKYSTKIIEFFKLYERKVYRIKVINENGNSLVELYDVEDGKLLNEALSKFVPENDESSQANTSEVQTPPSKALNDSAKKVEILDLNFDYEQEYESEAVMVAPFETHHFKVDTTNIKAIVLDTTLIEFGYVACIERNDFAYLSHVQNILANMDFEEDFYEPKLNEYCVALFEKEWYRGNVTKILENGKRFEISFTDFLNISILTKDDIRPYPKELKINCYTTLCQIDGLPKKVTKKQSEFLKKKIKINDIILIDRVLEILDGTTALIECSEIILAMQAAKVM